MCRRFVAASAPPQGLTSTQWLLMAALVPAMTGFDATFDGIPIEPDEFARGLARRTMQFRSRIVQNTILLALILRPLPAAVAERAASFAAELGVQEDMLTLATEFAIGNYGLGAVGFDRNGYIAHWRPEDAAALHTSCTLSSAWELAVDDPALAQRWADLEDLPLGHARAVGRRALPCPRVRLPGSAWFGPTAAGPARLGACPCRLRNPTVESELEVFGELERHRWWHPLVDVVQQLDLFAERGPELLEQARHDATVLAWVPPLARGLEAVEPRAEGRSRAVGRAPRHANLAADVPKALLDERLSTCRDLFGIGAMGVHIDVGGTAALATKKLVEGHAGTFGVWP